MNDAAAAAAAGVAPAAVLSGVSVRYDGRVVLGPLDLEIEAGHRWVVLGPNGSGKTTLVRVLALVQHPSTGEVTILGGRWGRVDVRVLRRRVAMSGAAMAEQLRPDVRVIDAVVSALHGALETWWHDVAAADVARATAALAEVDLEAMALRPYATLSSGERQRVLLARAAVIDPGLVILDEPTAGLDVAGREDLVERLDQMAARPSSPPIVLVTHHLEEIPAAFDHALLLSGGQVVAAGAIDDVLTDEALSACFGLGLTVARERDGRWTGRIDRRSR